MKVLFVWPNKDSFGFKPIGISLLSALSRSTGWKSNLYDTSHIDFGYTHNTDSGTEATLFKLVDLTNFGWTKRKLDLEEDFLTCLKEYDPDCLAFSVLSDERFIAKRLTKIAKKWNPRVPIIWGGKYPTIEPERALVNDRADFVCISEGLEAFPEFLNALSSGMDPYSIKNIWARKDDKILKNEIRPIIKDIDSLPYVDWSIFRKKGFFYKPFDGQVHLSGDHMLNWGCPYSCSYCINHILHRIHNNKYSMRRYSVNRIIEELKFLKEKYRLQFFKFHDEDFLMRPCVNLNELSDRYREEVNIPFVIETNPKTVTKEKVKLLESMNCVSCTMAIETGDSKLRKDLLKRIDSESDIIRAFNLFKDFGIRTSCFIMLGIPFENRNTYEKTIELIKKANVQYPIATFFFPFEKTELREISIKEGFYNPDDEEYNVYKSDFPALHFDCLTKDELIQMRKVFVLYSKLPNVYKKYIKRSEKLDPVGKRLRIKMVDIYKNTVWKNDGWYNDNNRQVQYIRELEMIISNEHH